MDGNPQIKTLKNRKFTKYRVISDGAGWSLDWDARNVAEALEALGLRKAFLPSRKTLIYFTSRDHFLRYSSLVRLLPSGTVIVDHFHGTPEDDPKYGKYFDAYKKFRDKLFGIRITNSSIQKHFDGANLGSLAKIIRIPVDTSLFCLANSGVKIRSELGIADDSVVIGSFQKDGVGWDDGLTPKLEKGPDLLVEVVRELNRRIKNLHVLLTGPARGYVYRSLMSSDVSVTWRRELGYSEIPAHYRSLDLYLITSRLEGGPKAALEAMACGVPLVSTPVGQVPELGLERCHGMVTSGLDIEEVVDAVVQVLRDGGQSECKRQLAESHNLESFRSDLQGWLID